MKKFYAYSLLEFMITLALLGILLLISIPAWNGFVVGNNVEAGADKLVAALQFARLEAVKRGENVSFCRLNDAKEGVGDWSQGQSIIDSGGNTIRTIDPVSRAYKLFWSGSLGKGDCIVFTSVGVTSGQHGNFIYCRQGRVGDALAVVIQTVGAIHVTTSLSGCGVSSR